MDFRERLTTSRLILRWPVLEDAGEVFARYANDAQVTKYLSWRPHASPAETRAFIERAAENRRNGISWSWLIYPLAGGPLLGSIGCRWREGYLQFGYCLARGAWGQGYATEAARAFVDTAFLQKTVWRVQAYCDIENLASARVLEKAGLEREAVLRKYLILPNLGDVPRDVYCYAKVRSQPIEEFDASRTSHGREAEKAT